MSNVTKYVRDAFKSLDLLEDTEFELDSKEDFEELDDFINADGDIPEKEVIDLDAETKEEVKDSYIGEVILECPVCHSDHFDHFEKVQDYIKDYKAEHDDEEPELVFEGEACPVCGNEDGFKIIGKVAPFELEDEEEDEVEVETDGDDVEVDVKEKEEVKEALKRKARKSLKESKKLKEGYTFEPGYHEWILWKDGDAVKSLGDITVDLPEVCNRDNLRQYAEDLTDQILWDDEDSNVDIASLKTDKSAVEDAIFKGLFAQYGEVVESKKSPKGKKLKESEDDLMTRYYNRDGLKPWRGCKSIKFKNNGSWADPDLIYKGYVFNYWDIEDALWSDFLEETGYKDSQSEDPQVEAEFNQYVCDRGPDYLDDYIASGAPKNWHSRFESMKSSKSLGEGFERKLEPGDTIVVGGSKVTVGKILDQYFDKDYIDIEFEDEGGNYRTWKSDVDGGKVIYKESRKPRKGRKLKEATTIKGLENAKNVAEEFKNYAAYKANFKPLTIVKQGKDYFVYKEGAKESSDYVQFGSKEYIDGWLYGCVQAKMKIVESRKSKKKLKEMMSDSYVAEPIQREIERIIENSFDGTDFLASIQDIDFDRGKLLLSISALDSDEDGEPVELEREVEFDIPNLDIEGSLGDQLLDWQAEHSSPDDFYESSKTKEGKKLTEAPVYELRPQYDSRQSFYGKAQVDTGDNNDKNKLYSYGTLVAEIKDGKPVVYGTYSQTTLRHIKDWLKQNGFKAETSKQIITDYGVKDECVNKQAVTESSLKKFRNNRKLKEATAEKVTVKWSEVFNEKQQAKLADLKGKKLDRETAENISKAIDKHLSDKGYELKDFLPQIDFDKEVFVCNVEKAADDSLQESIESATIETEDQVINVSSEDKEENMLDDFNPDFSNFDEAGESNGEEMIAPLSDEEVSELSGDSEEEETAEDEEEVIDEFPEDEEEFEFDEVQEESFNRLVGNYLNNVYSNAKSFKLKEAKSIDGQLKITGTIDFKSGKSKDTTFIFEKVANRKSIAKNKARFVGLNETFTDKKNAYVLRVSVKDKKLVAESLRYDYPAKGKLNESVKTVKGLVK